VGENGATSLGVMGSIGFLFLLGMVVWPPPPGRHRGEMLRTLAVLNFAAVLFATIGGFGSMFAWIVSPQIRTYSRMNVIIGFLAFSPLRCSSSDCTGAGPRSLRRRRCSWCSGFSIR
jgi:phosphoglycerol transferase